MRSSEPAQSLLAHPTFDDGPDPFWTPRILDALAESEARATFFVISSLAKDHRHLVERMLREGHEIALHCERHTRHTGMTEEEIRTDTRCGIEDLASVGVDPGNWRPPWGVVTDATRRVADEFGLRLALWSADTHDWRGDESRVMLRRIEEELAADSVVLMHDGLGPGATRDGCAETLALVPKLARAMRLRGLEAAPLGDRRRRNRRGEVRLSAAFTA